MSVVSALGKAIKQQAVNNQIERPGNAPPPPKSFDAPGEGRDNPGFLDHVGNALDPSAGLGQRINSGIQAVKTGAVAVKNAREQVFGGWNGEGTPQKQLKYDYSREQNEITPQKHREQPLEPVEAADDDSDMPESGDNEPAAPAGGSGDPRSGGSGGTMVAGGMRVANSISSRSNGYSASNVVRKKHTWMIYMDQKDYKPVMTLAGGNQQYVILESRWHEVPDNEVAFYCDRADLSYMNSCGRYLRITGAGWRITKADVITVNDRSDGTTATASLQSQWQPSISVARPLECMPTTRQRFWRDASSWTLQATADNSWDRTYHEAGAAHMGSPRFLPKCVFYMSLSRFASANAPDVGADVLWANNNNNDSDGHFDPFYYCCTEYEMGTTVPPIVKSPYKGYRGRYRSPFAPFTDSPVDDVKTVEVTKNFTYGDKRRNVHPHVSTFSKTAAAFPWQGSVYRSPHTELVGPDPFDIRFQFRNDRDEYMPHLNGLPNAPCFLAINRLPGVPNQSFQVCVMLEIESELHFTHDTPILFPFNHLPTGTSSSRWSGDNRCISYLNDATNITTSGDITTYNRPSDVTLPLTMNIG